MHKTFCRLAAAATLTLSHVGTAWAQDTNIVADNSTTQAITATGIKLPVCEPGLFIPVWEPIDNISTADKAARAIVYFLGLVYLFLGVSIIADRFMASIEVITSKEREIIVKRPNGEILKVSVKVWNETVSNLTLMALGSSAPEILLAIIEVAGKSVKCLNISWRALN